MVLAHCISNIDDSVALFEQRFHNVTRLYMILSYPVSDERAHHGCAMKKISNSGTPGWPEKAVLGAFVLNRVEKEYPNALSQRANFAPAPIS